MKIKIYQINMDRDKQRICFCSLKELEKFQGNAEVNGELYDQVFDGEVSVKDLERVYWKFNLEHPDGYTGRSLSTSDVIEVVQSETVKPGFYYCDSFGFQPISFSPRQPIQIENRNSSPAYKDMDADEIREQFPRGTRVILQHMKGEDQMKAGMKGVVSFVDSAGQIHVKWENGSRLALNTKEDTFQVDPAKKISVLLVMPKKAPKLIEMEDTLEAMQDIVGGGIEEYMPFEDDVAIICNGDGKEIGLNLNRAIYNDQNEVMDIIAGNFLIVGADLAGESYSSLSESLAKKYSEKFRRPERFVRTENDIEVIPFRSVEERTDR